MPATILTIAQQKGGAGKTTLVAQLAVAFAKAGRKVATLDIDPQASLTGWAEARGDRAPAITHRAVSGWKLEAEVKALARDHDIVLIDSPPHQETEARIAVRAATRVLVPVQPSPMDVWATKPTLELAAREKTPVLLVINRAPPRARLADALIGEIHKLGVPVARTVLGNRTAYAASMLTGQGVVETAPRTRAAEEIRALAKGLV